MAASKKVSSILIDRDNPIHVRGFAQELAAASGVEWEKLSLESAIYWFLRAKQMLDHHSSGGGALKC